MAQQLTEWKPDTCGCKLRYSWDSDDEVPVNTPVSFVSGPDCHTHADLQACDATLRDENLRKNKVEAVVKRDFPEAKFEWSYDKTRNLDITVDIAPEEKTDLLATLDSEIGAEKIIVK